MNKIEISPKRKEARQISRGEFLALTGGAVAAAVLPSFLINKTASAESPNDATPIPTDIPDTEPSEHPSKNDRNVEPGNSGTQGKSESNPDGNGVDKPYDADGQPARSQGRNDNDGNNGCGNDNDFSDDNNGNCGGKRKETPQPTETPKPTQTPPTTETVQPTPTSTTPAGTATSTPATPQVQPSATPTGVRTEVIPPTVTRTPTPTSTPRKLDLPGQPTTLPRAGEWNLTALAGVGALLAGAGTLLRRLDRTPKS